MHRLHLPTLTWRGPPQQLTGQAAQGVGRVAGHTLTAGLAFGGCIATVVGIVPISKMDVLLLGAACMLLHGPRVHGQISCAAMLSVLVVLMLHLCWAHTSLSLQPWNMVGSISCCCRRSPQDLRRQRQVVAGCCLRHAKLLF